MTYVSCFYHAFSGAQKVSWRGRSSLQSCPHCHLLSSPSPSVVGALARLGAMCAECWLGKTSSHRFPVAGGARRLPWFGLASAGCSL